MEQVLAAIDTVMATGKVAAYAVVSIWADGEDGDVAVDSGVQLIARRAGVVAAVRGAGEGGLIAPEDARPSVSS